MGEYASFFGWDLILLIILIRYAVVAGIFFLIYYVWKKRAWAFQKIQSRFPQSIDYLREVGYSLLTILIFAAIGYVVFFSPLLSYTLVYQNISDYGIEYFILSIGLMLLLHDTYFYWTHRAMHHPSIYKWFHQVHHLSTNPSPWAAYAFHPLEAVVEAGIVVLIVFVMPTHPMAVSLFLLIMMVYNVYGHLGYELYPKGFSKSAIGKWINTSVNHNQHHQFFRGNYGLYFLWWDRWMGTIRTDYDTTFEKIKSQSNS
ncbi:MAG: sterol desaturase family protein [Cyclobacteriaceae bacterium]|nr:sterol desaturase family protein [Cyclobacteriaceae bacterium]